MRESAPSYSIFSALCQVPSPTMKGHLAITSMLRYLLVAAICSSQAFPTSICTRPCLPAPRANPTGKLTRRCHTGSNQNSNAGIPMLGCGIMAPSTKRQFYEQTVRHLLPAFIAGSYKISVPPRAVLNPVTRTSSKPLFRSNFMPHQVSSCVGCF